MDLMQIRHRLLMQSAPAPSGGYVTDGLILWLDGIDKGNTSGAWTDKVNGDVFTAYNGVTFGTDYVQLDKSQSQYLDNSSFTSVPSTSDGTIEIVISEYSENATQIVFLPTSSGKLAFGIYSSGQDRIIWSSGGNKLTVNITEKSNAEKTFSISDDRQFINGTQGTTNSNNAWSSLGSVNYIGRRQSGNYFNGKIHSIRIYNRKLTEAEVLQNQRYDNARFNLGLTI